MLLPLSIIFLTLDHVYTSGDTFHEELLVYQLTSGHVYTQFQFSTLWNVNIFEEKLRKFLLFFYVSSCFFV